MSETHAHTARRLLGEARECFKDNPARAHFLLGVAGVYAGLEIAEQGRHLAQALVLLTQPTGTPDHASRLAALADIVDYPDGQDPAGNLAQLLEEQYRERAERREQGKENGL